MSFNRYPISLYTETDLVAKYRLVNEVLDRGSQTSAGMEPGVKHEFAEKSDAELRAILKDIMQSLYLINPDKYPNPETQNRMKICTRYT